MNSIHKIGFGGGCHWCTEAVFQSLKGVTKVSQGWIASNNENGAFSEAVIVEYLPNEIPLAVLIEIHLHTHKSTSLHSMREKFRSAVYYFEEERKSLIEDCIENIQTDFESPIITQVLPFVAFQTSREEIQNYYYSNPSKPFCEKYINPKLNLLLEQFSNQVKVEKLNKNNLQS